MNLFKKIYFLFRIKINYFTTKSYASRPLIFVIPENYFSFFYEQFKKFDSIFILYEGKSLNLKILENQQERYYFRLAKTNDLKQLADFFFNHKFSIAVFFKNEGFRNYLPCFKYIKTQNLICINKDYECVLKTKKCNCFAQLNLGSDDVKLQEDIRNFFKNILGNFQKIRNES